MEKEGRQVTHNLSTQSLRDHSIKSQSSMDCAQPVCNVPFACQMYYVHLVFKFLIQPPLM